jgi:hypothetical protein
MDQRTKILNRIISDYHIILINSKKYVIRRPTQDILYQAQLEYENILTECKFNDWLSEEDCTNHLIRIGKWTPDGDKKIKDIHKFIEDQKVALYHSAIEAANDQVIRTQLAQAKDILNRMYGVKTSLHSFTLQGFAQVFKHQYILEHTIYRNDKRLDYVSPKILNQIKMQLLGLNIGPTEIREIARTDPWRSYCGIVDNPFSKNFVDLDDDKRALMTYTKMYDNIHENPDCPPQNVIDDDDMLDGWMIVQGREKKEKKKEKNTDNIVHNLSPKYQNANEIFIPVKTQEQRDKVMGMNNLSGKMVQKQRQELLNKQPQVGAGKLPDEVLARSNQEIQQLKQHSQQHSNQ